MIETVYRVNGRIFQSKHDAEEYEHKMCQEVYCSNCKEFLGIAENCKNLKIDYLNFSACFTIQDDGWDDFEFDFEPVENKYLCPQCKFKFKNQLTEYKNLIDKLFNDFNLTKREKKNNQNNNRYNDIIDIDNPNSTINQYIKQKDQEVKEWITEKEGGNINGSK